MESPTHYDPEKQPASHISAPPPSRQPFKTYGQNYRYAETFHNPFPEVVCVGPASTPAPAAVGVGATADEGISGASAAANTPAAAEHDAQSSFFQNDTSGASKEGSGTVPEAALWAEPPETPWYKTISKRRWLAILVCTVGITGVVLAILGAMNKLSGEGTTDVPAIPASNETSSSARTSTATTTSSTISSSTRQTSSSTPSAAPLIDCSSPETFLTSVTWVGTDVGKYKGEFAQAASPEACCRSCLGHAQEPSGSRRDPRGDSAREGGDEGEGEEAREAAASGCAGWLYNATSAFTPCTKIVVLSPGSRARGNKGGEDEICPRGYADVTYFAVLDDDAPKDAKRHAGVGGMGPCALEKQIR
ncbi:hypothetical protein VTJ83DRAFT_3684 [Remersonia thermophila]|uniref:Uncharacterized protein n=1 Tax=Remersonia thermophila TaxID=72144 RepID=A0ABR4DEP1_9PEZI